MGVRPGGGAQLGCRTWVSAVTLPGPPRLPPRPTSRRRVDLEPWGPSGPQARAGRLRGLRRREEPQTWRHKAQSCCRTLPSARARTPGLSPTKRGHDRVRRAVRPLGGSCWAWSRFPGPPGPGHRHRPRVLPRSGRRRRPTGLGFPHFGQQPVGAVKSGRGAGPSPGKQGRAASPPPRRAGQSTSHTAGEAEFPERRLL